MRNLFIVALLVREYAVVYYLTNRPKAGGGNRFFVRFRWFKRYPQRVYVHVTEL
ncbi:unnamed protein product [Callosobruchus maculatus]|uniref:Uncharacterized protein n=1 Tax=Callosobruchus maculatus TaxID=64391 RepID=A0A653BFA4_CALMS|nr:unnamed protein product [Callosobruchus maculatus]